MKEKIAVYAGTFDPVTNGHLDVIERGSRLFDKLYVTIFVNPKKQTLFTVDERVNMLKQATHHLDNVIIDYRTKYFEEEEKNKELELQIEQLTKKIDEIKKILE